MNGPLALAVFRIAHGRPIMARCTPVPLADDHRTIDYAALDRLTDRFAAGLQRDGVAQGCAVAIVAHPSIEPVVAFLGAVRAGNLATPIAPSATGSR